MAHTFVIQSVAHIGDALTVTGTVDGIQTTAQGWFSALTAAPNVAAAQSYLCNLLLAVAFPPAPATTAIYNGTMTQ